MEFLHRQLDEVIAIWARGSGQGKFQLTVAEGVPDLQFGIHLNFQDAPLHKPHHNPHQHHHHTKRRRGPARQSRDRLRAAQHQAKSAVAASVTAEKSTSASASDSFPGIGIVLGTAAKPSLPIPLEKAVFPPPPSTVATSPILQVDPMVVPTIQVSPPMATITTSTASLPIMSVPTSLLSPALVHVRDELHSESESESEDDEQLTPGTRLMLSACALCHQPFTSSSGPGYCPQCAKCYHTECGGRHHNQCMAFHFA